MTAKLTGCVVTGLALAVIGSGCGRREPPKPAPEAPEAPGGTQEVSAVEARMQNAAYMEQLRAFNTRQREKAIALDGLRVQMEARLKEWLATSEAAQATEAKIKALREKIAEAEREITAREAELRELAAADGRWQELAGQVKAAEAEIETVQRELREWVGAEMRRQAAAGRAAVTNTPPAAKAG